MTLEQELRELEEQFWTAAGRPAFYRERLASDAVIVLPAPTGILDEEAILDTIEDAPPWDSVRIEDCTLVHLRDAAAVLAYHAEARNEAGETYTAYAASAYVRQDDGAWKLAFHQQTPITG